MEKAKWITGVIIICSFTVYAQREASQPKANSAQQGGARDSINTAPQNPADTTGSAGATQNKNTSTGGTTSAGASNTPAVEQTTTSQGGSPAVLSGKDGSQRDGTNNVQRASMNMAGSPANNLKLSDKRQGDADSEIKDRQQYSRDKQTSAQRQDQKNGGAGASSGNQSAQNSGEVNDKNRRENNALSDQNKSSKRGTGTKPSRKKG